MVNFRVNDMTCGHCAGTIRAAIITAAPQADIEVDLSARRVAVEGVTDIDTVERAIREAGYTTSTLFRPPYGKKLFGLPWYLHKHNRTSITWDIEPETYPDVARSSQTIVRHVLSNTRPGSIILLHVMYDKERKSMQAVRPMIKGLRARGYHFVTVSELLAAQ